MSGAAAGHIRSLLSELGRFLGENNVMGIDHPQAPARVGMHVSEVATPALMVDLDAMMTNIAVMRALCASYEVRLRPHAKAHKSLDIARHQIQAGAVGLCCQTLTEAEIFVAGGIGDVLISNEIIDRGKLDRVAALARRANIGICVDDEEQVVRLAEAAERFAARIEVMLEIDVGQGRCGVGSVDEALRLAASIRRYPSLALRGLQAYHGKAQHFRSALKRNEAIAKAAHFAATVRSALQLAGFPVGIISGGGTGTCALECASAIYNEIQPGSYALMDADYALNESPPPFRQALTLATTVVSVAVRGQVVVDAGYKAFAVDSGWPVPVRPDLSVLGMSDEHTVLCQSADDPIRLGHQIRFVPRHIDPTVNLHDWIVGYRGVRVEMVWPVSARGPGL
jgi:D-serine deaminase-like pyridoxal phosphate-dependent protein